jgi:hypothetical protein
MDVVSRSLSTPSKVSASSSNTQMIGSIKIGLIIRLNCCLRRLSVFCRAYRMRTAF